MNATKKAPETLLEAVQYFADRDTALEFVAALRWPDGPTCPDCGAPEPSFLKTRGIWKCRSCKRQFSVKVGTIFEDSPISLSKWLPAMWLLANCKNGISSYELARALGVTQKTAWFMLHRIRLAMQSEGFGPFDGEVEVDETFIGGKARNMHREKRERVIKGSTGTIGKVAVMGLLERNAPEGSQVRLRIVPNTRRHNLQPHVTEHVIPGATIHSDALASYAGLDRQYIHNVIDHAERYAEGNVHTNGLENFWSLLKRGVRGTYVSIEPFHLFRYLDEQAFRFNTRKDDDRGRFMSVVRSIVGKRVTFEHLTGKDLCTT